MYNYKKQIESKVTTFDALARKVSEDPGSKDRGGQYQINRNEKTWDQAFLSGRLSFERRRDLGAGRNQIWLSYHHDGAAEWR